MKPYWKVDVPVVINFFARPNDLEKTFLVIKKARPRILFLVADGPRKNVSSDIENVRKCREIVENIDWECEVYRYYSDENKGLFRTYFEAMDQVFEIVDRCIFLEDDLVVSESFFRFCKEMLDKYEKDLRVHFITGLNYMGNYTEPDGDYFFSGEGSIWGYALWKRTYTSMNLDFRKNAYAIRCTQDVAKQIKNGYEKRIQKTVVDPMWEGHIPHVEFYKNFLRFSENQIYIVPSKNLVSNIGVGSDSMHSADDLTKIPYGWRQLYFMKTYELKLPFKEPEFMVRDIKYEKYVNRVLAWNDPGRQLWRKFVALIKAVQYGDFRRIKYKIIHLFISDEKR